MSICPSVCPSLSHAGGSYCQTSFRPDCPIICIFDLQHQYPIPREPFLRGRWQKYWGNGKIVIFEIATCHCCGLTPVNEHLMVHKLAFYDVYSLCFSHRILANPSWYIHINSVRKFSALFNNSVGKYSFYYIFFIYIHCSTSIPYHGQKAS